jgi:hypothetical protein
MQFNNRALLTVLGIGLFAGFTASLRHYRIHKDSARLATKIDIIIDFSSYMLTGVLAAFITFAWTGDILDESKSIAVAAIAAYTGDEIMLFLSRKLKKEIDKRNGNGSGNGNGDNNGR